MLCSNPLSRLVASIAIASACVAGCKTTSTIGTPTTAAASEQSREWASSICALLLAAGDVWASPLQAAQEESASMNTGFEPRKLRRLLVRAMDKSVRAEDATIGSLDAIDPPAAEGADEFQRALREGFVHYRDAKADLADRARKLPVETSSDSLAAFEAFASDFRQLSATPPEPDIEARSAFEELKQAWQRARGCAYLAYVPKPPGTATSLQSEAVLVPETSEAQRVMSAKAAFWDSLPPDEQLAERELQVFLRTDSGITADEAERTRELVEFLQSE